MIDAHDLVSQARGTHVVVVGAGLAGLTVAWECAKVGMAVTVVETAPAVGGLVRHIDLDGVLVDGVVDSFDLDAPMTRLLDELDLSEPVRVVPPVRRWVGLDGPGGGFGAGAVAALPDDAVLGIPSNAWDSDVRRIIGWRGTWRAYLDRLRPPLTIGHERNLGALVRRRMGDRVCERMVAPVVRAAYGLEPEQVDVEHAAPGLSGALTRVGSLAGAVAAAREGAGDTPRRVTLDGGLGELTDTIAARLADLDVDIRTSTAATALARTGADARSGWSVTTRSVALPGAEISGVDTAGPETDELRADVVVVATDAAAALTLFDGVVDVPADGLTLPGRVDVVTFRAVVAAGERAEVLPSGGAVRRVVDLVSAGIVATDSLDAGERLVRVTLDGSAGEDTGQSDEAVIRAARAAASDALGIAMTEASVRAAVRVRAAWTGQAQLGHANRVATLRADAARAGLVVTGAWAVGGGVGAVIADAVEAAGGVRRSVLWERQPQSDPE